MLFCQNYAKKYLFIKMSWSRKESGGAFLKMEKIGKNSL